MEDDELDPDLFEEDFEEVNENDLDMLMNGLSDEDLQA